MRPFRLLGPERLVDRVKDVPIESKMCRKNLAQISREETESS